jgi:hypothetical protein
MDTSNESDSDVEASAGVADLGISESEAQYNYQEAGKLVTEEKDEISLKGHADLIDPSCEAILAEVEKNLALPYSLSDFQKLSMNILLQKKDLIVLSPTGSGKECLLNFILGGKLVQAACMRFHGTKCPLLTAFFSLLLGYFSPRSGYHWVLKFVIGL